MSKHVGWGDEVVALDTPRVCVDRCPLCMSGLVPLLVSTSFADEAFPLA